MAVNKRLLQGAAAAPGGGITPSEHFGVALYEGDGSSSHSINGGKFGAGAYFNGTGVVDTGLSTTNFVSNLNDRTVDFSFSCWAQINSYPQGDNTIFYIGNYNVYSPNYAAIILDFRNATKKIQFTHQTQSILSTSTFNAPNTWVHIAAVRDNSVLKLYINGSLESSVTLTADTQVSSSTTLDIGGFKFSSSTVYSGLDGKIDQVRVFSKALSSSEVSTLYAETVETVESLDPLSEDTTDTLQVLGDSSCIATYRFENNEDDLSGNYDGTGTAIQYAAGRYGQAASFNGSSSKIAVNGLSLTQTSISLWVNFNTLASKNHFIFSFNYNGTNSFVLYCENGDLRFLDSAPAVNVDASLLSTTTLTTNQWYNFVISISSSQVKSYINGSIEQTVTSNRGSTQFPMPFELGYATTRALTTAYFNGKIDQVRIFNKEISAAEVTTLYNENSLVASYRFEGNANDDTRNYDGTATNVTYEYGLGFTPDFVWIKERNAAESHRVYDSTRGATKEIYTNLTNAEVTNTQSLTSFDTGGFTVGSSSVVNNSGETYVAWCFKANGGTTSSNTDGSITSTVQANTQSGFSIVRMNAGSTNGDKTAGHGLGVKPAFVLFRRCPDGSAWFTWHQSLSQESYYLYLHSDLGEGDLTQSGNAWGNQSFTDTTISWNTGWTVSANEDLIAYCFAEVDGFSKFGSYTGNGSTNGPIVETGFEPAWLMVKGSSNTGSWIIFDNKRNLINPRDKALRADSSAAETTSSTIEVDFLSNGFQLTGTDTDYNGSGRTYIYMAFAADPDTEAPTVAKSFSTVSYTGTGAIQSIDGLGFSPSLVWLKNDTYYSTFVYDTIRGATETLYTAWNSAELVETGLTSFDDDGFTLGSLYFQNRNGDTYYAWAWKADDNEPTIFGGPAVAVYKFEDNANDVTGDYNGTASNVTYSSSGKFNKAAVFNGSSSKVESSTISSKLLNDYSISFWVYLNTIGSTDGIMGLYTFNTNDGMSLAFANGNLILNAGDGQSQYNPGSPILSTGQWYHVVITLKDGGDMKLYIDGNLQATLSSINNSATSSSILRLGLGSRTNNGLYSYNQYLDGEIDQVRIYNGALAQEQVTELYNETASQNDDLNLGGPPEIIISANANAGFSIVQHTGTGVAGKIPHGLSATPEMIIRKNIDAAKDWNVYHSGAGLAMGYLNHSDTFSTTNNAADSFDRTAPTSTVFSVGQANNQGNINGNRYIAYCFHSVAGYSKFGSYTGNGSTNAITGLGFQPDWILIKDTSAAESWRLFDSVRGVPNTFFINTASAETTDSGLVSFDSDGFTLGYDWYSRVNTNGNTYIYMAFKIN